MAIESAQLTIARHCVAQTPSGLSPLQQALLDDPHRVRIVDAPTGAGKTYAFQQALLHDARILFIVPTRRLAQNIAASVVNDLHQQAGWTAIAAENKVKVWSSDQSSYLRETAQVKNISGYRLRQLEYLDSSREGGEMIVAIPEVVSHLLLSRGLDMGNASMGVFHVLSSFDHIVFDEFHTIEARGFGLAALLAQLASAQDEQGHYRFGRAKVSLLSATPLNIKPVLTALGITENSMTELHETLVSEDKAEETRPLHGDVRLNMLNLPDMLSVLAEHSELLQAELAAKRQVVLIYNKLGDLQRDLSALAHYFQRQHIATDRVLIINSIDDSGGQGRLAQGFYVGQQRNPDDFDVLIATASVEMGVTFRDARLMLMEPGFAPMNFLQRYGRAARRGKDGQVIVRIDQDLLNKMPWLRDLQQWMLAHQHTSQSILSLSERLSRSVQQAFSQEHDVQVISRNTNETLYFGELPRHTMHIVGLYWQELLKHKSNKAFRRQHLVAHQPKSSKRAYYLLKMVQTLENDENYKESCQRWLKKLREQVLQLRDIGRRITVIEGNGRTVKVPQLWLERETNILRDCVEQRDENDQPYFQLHGDLEDFLLAVDEKNQAQRLLTTYFPHCLSTEEIKADASQVKAWRRLLENKADIDTEFAWEDHPKAMQAALDLVQSTGLIPSEESEIQSMFGVF